MIVSHPMIAFTQRLVRPFQLIGDGLELRRLRRLMPSAHRRLISTRTGTRTETDAEYLDRLRNLYDERFGEDSRSPMSTGSRG